MSISFTKPPSFSKANLQGPAQRTRGGLDLCSEVFSAGVLSKVNYIKTSANIYRSNVLKHFRGTEVVQNFHEQLKTIKTLVSQS